jgi:hypothetical protein
MKFLPLTALATALSLQGAMTPTDIARKAGPAVVTIQAKTADGTSAGSGLIVDPSGTIVTNLHVIAGATAAAVKLPDGDIYDQVMVRTFDARKDLAVIQVQGFKLPTVPLGDSDTVQVGDAVVLMGSPLGVLENSLTTGVISGIRALEEAGFRVIQTDAAANPGNSGGPLLDSAGRAIGVLSFKLKGKENMNFAIPINYVRGMLGVSQMFTLEELARRASSVQELFAPTTSASSTRWRSLSSGATKVLRVRGEYLYIETVLTDAERQAGDFLLADLKKFGTGFKGVQKRSFLCEYRELGAKVNRCTAEEEMEITTFTPDRIEGTLAAWSGRFNCKKCEWRDPPKRTSFTWIPE